MKSATLALVSILSASALAGCPAQCSDSSSDILSCHNSSSVPDTCCFNSPGGQLVQTQFWDVDPASGPSNHWTVHGLWPDYCDGTYPQNCDSKRAYTNITQILESFGQTTLLNYMRTYWTDYQGNDESFWEHEWSKHGTCISTLKPSCYTNYSPTEEVVDFFSRTVALFQSLDTYQFLADADILPSSSKTYSYSEIMDALNAPRGVNATIQCSSGQLDEVWYTFNVKGSVQLGQFVNADPTGESSSCSKTAGIKYLPKELDTAKPTSSVGTARQTATISSSCRSTANPPVATD